MNTYELELTDTFGGQANYGWVQRLKLELPSNTSERTLVRKAKEKLGLTGVRCRKELMADVIALYPSGSCTVAFILPQN